MTTLRQIVIDAYRESGLTAVGDTPDADEFDEGLRRLQTVIKSVFGNELGEPLQTVNYGSFGLTNSYGTGLDNKSAIDSVYAPNNTRLICNTNTANTIYLTPNPRDGARFGVIDNGGNFLTYPLTIKGNGRGIELATSIVLNTDSVNREWFYRADLGNWQRVTDLLSSDVMPLPQEFDDFFTTVLAIRINPRHGAQTAEETVEVFKQLRRQFRARYRQNMPQDSELALIRLPSLPLTWNSQTPFTDFKTGRF